MVKKTKYFSDAKAKEICSHLAEAKLIVEGKSKRIYKLKDACLMEFKPHLRSITSKREEDISGTEFERIKACLAIYTYLEKRGIPTQLLYSKLVKKDGRYFMLIKCAKQIPVEWISRFYAAGSIVRLFPSLVQPGEKFKVPLQKYDYKYSVPGIDDPTLNESYLLGLNLVTENELDLSKFYLAEISRWINNRLQKENLRLVDLKMEFGKDKSGKIILTDEISQDCMRVEDTLGNSLTKDSFRQMKSSEEVLESYARFTLLWGKSQILSCD